MSVASSGCGELRLLHRRRVSRFPFPTSHPCLRGRTDVHVCDVLWNGCSWFGTCVCGLVRVRGRRWGFVCATHQTGQTNRPKTSPRTPHNPAPASSVTLPKSERHHSKCLRMVGAPTYPNDGDYPAHSSTQRSSNAPTARPQGQQRSEASSQTSSPEAQRGSGTATRPAAPPPLLRIAAAPQPQHRR